MTTRVGWCISRRKSKGFAKRLRGAWDITESTGNLILYNSHLRASLGAHLPSYIALPLTCLPDLLAHARQTKPQIAVFHF